MRPRGSNEPLYSPERDLGHFLVPVFENYVLGVFDSRKAIAWLDDATARPASEAQRQDAARRLREALDHFRDPNVSSANEGLEAAGFWDCDVAARRDVLAVLGLVIVSKYFHDVRAAHGFPDVDLARMFVASPMMREALEAGMEVLGIDEAVRRGKGR